MSFSRDGNRSGSGRVQCPGTQNRNPNLKPEPDLNTDLGQNPSPKLKPVDTPTRLDTRNLFLYDNIVRAIISFYKRIHIYKIYMYKQVAINSK